jgi:hypothetical protein
MKMWDKPILEVLKVHKTYTHCLIPLSTEPQDIFCESE